MSMPNSQSQKYNYKNSKCPVSQKSKQYEAVNRGPFDGSGDETIQRHYTNTIEDDTIYSESYLYCKPFASIGRRKVLKKRRPVEKKDTFATDTSYGRYGIQHIGSPIDERNHATKNDNVLGIPSRSASKTLLFKNIVNNEQRNDTTQIDSYSKQCETSENTVHHAARRYNTVRFDTSMKPTPHPLLAGASGRPKEPEAKLRSCLKKSSVQSHSKTEEPQLNSPSEIFQAQSALAGPPCGHFFRPVPKRCMCAASPIHSNDYGELPNYVMAPEQMYQTAEVESLLSTITEEGEGFHSDLPKKHAFVEEDCNKNCTRCDKIVYFAEKKMAAGLVFHIRCFSCFTCGKKLDSSNLQEKNSELYCKACFIL